MRGSTHSATRHAAIGGLGVLLAAASLLSGGAASATEGDDRGFPDIGKEWYFTAPAFIYGDGPPAPYPDDSLTKRGIKANYYMPGGRSPSAGQGDISIVYSPPPGQAPSETVDIDFSAFSQMYADLGTAFVDSFVIPIEPTHDAQTGAEVPQPEILAQGSRISVTRPSVPADCKATEPQAYEFQVALLGDNGFKYLVDVRAIFGERSASSTCTAVAPEIEPEPYVYTEQSESQGETTPTPQVVGPGYNWLPIILIFGAGAVVVGLVRRFKLIEKVKNALGGARPSSGRRFTDDGTPLSAESVALEEPKIPSPTKQTTRKMTDLLFGKPRIQGSGNGFSSDD